MIWKNKTVSLEKIITLGAEKELKIVIYTKEEDKLIMIWAYTWIIFSQKFREEEKVLKDYCDNLIPKLKEWILKNRIENRDSFIFDKDFEL